LTRSFFMFGRYTALLLCTIALAGCSTAGPMSDDHGKRTIGTSIDDMMVASRAKSNIKSVNEQLGRAHIDVTSFNGVVLLTGQVPSEGARQEAEQAVDGLRNVRVIHNELEVAGPTSIPSRMNDSYLSTKVKTALLADNNTEGGRTKVITENGVVYLMGLLTRDEAEAAVSKAREVYGVQKIVKVFEYIN
jgi:osmotically-inducible protein OsmY